MSISERILKIRKENRLTRAKFGEQIGVSQDVINNIERNRNKNGVPDNIIKLIAMKFKVNENWLRTGKGEMFDTYSNDDTLIDKLSKEYNLNSFHKNLAKIYLSLTEQQKQAVQDFMQKVCNESSDTTTEEAAAAEPQEYINMSLEELAKLQAKHAAKVAEIESIINFKNEDMDFLNENILA